MHTQGVRFSLLGPVRAWHGDREIDLGEPRQRAVLALLLLNRGRPVTLEVLSDRVWGVRLPSTARSTMRTYLSRLRRALTVGSPLESGRGGYTVAVSDSALDLAVFSDLVERARVARLSGDTETAAALLHEALGLWRGPALGGARGDFVAAERAELEQRRQLALQERIAADLDLGRHREVLTELSELVAENPLRERPRELWMLALYRCGRRAEALEVYRAGRELLDREVGLEPGPGLRALHEHILGADPSEAVGGPGRRMLADRLHRARDRHFVGRGGERDLFASALAGDAGDLVTLFLHGPGGIGKSTLLRRLADDAEATGRGVFWVDGQTAGSPRAFAAAAAGVHSPGAVLLVDTFERCQALEPWLREEFLPGLPADALVVIAGRRPPGPSWRTDPSWASALHVCPVHDLGPADAAALLQARGVPPELREPVLAFAAGLPMALSLAAEVVTGDGVTTSFDPSQDVIPTLLAELVGAVPSADHQRALQVCAHAYGTTEDLLRVALPGSDARALFSWLRELPFIESSSRGIYPHDVVRGALDTDLRRRDPTGYAQLHSRVRGYVFGQLVAPHTHGVWALRALRHLRRNGGVLQRFISSEGETDAEEDVLRAEDHAGVLAMAAGTEGEESARIVEFWLHRQPSAFTVYRHLDTGELVAFMAWLRLAEPRADEMAADPVVAAAWAHSLAVAPPHPGEHIGLARHMVHPAAYMRPSPIADLLQMRALAAWLGERRMAWSYAALAYPDFWQPLLDYIDQTRLPATPTLDGREFGIFAHDWRLEPPERWRNRHLALELYGAE